MTEEVKFTKQQFLQAESFTPVQRDVLRSLLEDGEVYTLRKAQEFLNEYAQRKVK